MKNSGEESLSNQELLNVLLGRGSSGDSVMVLSQKLLNKFGTIQNIASASLEELRQIKGIGFAKACQLKAAFELGKRSDQTNSAQENYLIDTPEKAALALAPLLKNKKKEHIFLLLVDTRKKLIKKSLISIGTLDASLIHPRDIFKEVISGLAAGFILIHNHPSGDPSPSSADISLTKQLISAAKFLDINFLDHIIIGNPSYYSFKERNSNLFS